MKNENINIPTCVHKFWIINFFFRIKWSIIVKLLTEQVTYVNPSPCDNISLFILVHRSKELSILPLPLKSCKLCHRILQILLNCKSNLFAFSFVLLTIFNSYLYFLFDLSIWMLYMISILEWTPGISQNLDEPGKLSEEIPRGR